MISAGKFTEGPFSGRSLQAATTDYLDFVNRTYPLPWAETVQIDSELQRRKECFPGVCPICGYYNPSARNNRLRNNRFALGSNRKGRR